MTQLVNQFAIGKEKGQLDMRFNANTIQVRAVSTLATPLVAGQAVKLVDNSSPIPEVDIAGDTDEVFGYVNYALKGNSYSAGMVLEISLKGNVMFMIAGAAIARGAEIMHVAATGKVITATGVTKCISGWAFDKAAQDGDIVRVYIEAPSFKKPAA